MVPFTSRQSKVILIMTQPAIQSEKSSKAIGGYVKKKKSSSVTCVSQ